MKHILTILFLISNTLQVSALDVVKPSTVNSTVNESLTYVFGTVKPQSTLEINSQPVKIWEKNMFVQVIPLSYGVNTVKFVEKHNDGTKETKVFYIKRNKISPVKKAEYIPRQTGTVLYSKTVKNHAPVREKPDNNANRAVELPKDTVLYLAGKQGDYYKIEETGNTEFWISKNYISQPTVTDKRMPADVGLPKKSEDKLYNYLAFPVSYPVLYTLKQDENKLNLTLYGVKNKKNFDYVYENKSTTAGYEGIYKDNNFIIKTAKIPKIKHKNKPLNNIRIFIDAGHGGKELGATGITRIPEKDINLSISKKIIDLLKKDGAIVSYSRIDDHFVDLYKRVEMAKENNAFISVSIHNNALPESKNPLVNHGTETYYYNNNAVDLAEKIKNNLVEDLNLNDNGTHFSGFVLTRETNPVSVLVEIAYMINPEEYLLLQDENFQMQAAESIRKSLCEYILSLQKSLR